MTDIELAVAKAVRGTHELEVRPLQLRVAQLEAAIRPLADRADEMERIYQQEQCDVDAMVSVLTYGEAKLLRDLLRQATT